MPDLGNAVLTLRVAGEKFKQGLNSARKQTGDFAAKSEKQVGRVRGAFGKLGTGIKGAAGQVPLLGGAMTALANPVTAIAVGVGAVVVALGKMVGRIVDLEKALRPMIERSGIASDSLQLLAKAAEVAGSEDGLEGVTDSAQELQLRLAEVVQDGTGPAKEAFEKLGISAQDLIDKSPEDMLLTVVAALQNVTNESDRKFLADELLGGSSEKLAGLLNLTNEELGNQLQHLADTGDFMSGEALADAKAYSGSVDVLKNSFSSMATQIGSVLIPILTGLVEALNSMGKGLDWVAKVMGWAKDDTNEFTEAADEMAEVLGDGTAPAIVITTEAAEEAAPAVAKMGDEVATATGKVAELTSTSRTGAEVIEALRVKSLDAKSAIELMRLEVETADRSVLNATGTTGEYTDAVAQMNDVLETWRVKQLDARQEADLLTLSMGAARTGFSNVSAEVDPLAALIAEMTQRITDAEAQTRLEEQALAALPPALRAAAAQMGLFGLSVDSVTGSLNAATSAQERFNQSQRDATNDASGNAALTNPHPGGGRTSGRHAGDSYVQGSGRITHVDVIRDGELYSYKTHRSGGKSFRAGPASQTPTGQQRWSSYGAAILAWLAANAPQAQHGAAVRGSRYGSLVRVGENFTNENITPVGRNGGGSGGSGPPMVIPVNLGGETLATIYVEGKRVAVREGRD